MAKKKHLYEIDLMRTFIMLGVLSVHTIARYIEMIHANMSPGLIALGTIITSLHFTRESFMFITGLVLFVTYYHKKFNPFKFWWKRLTLVAVPYVVWNIVYVLFGGTYEKGFNWSPIAVYHDIIWGILTGKLFYLYFVMVSIQFYVVFPILLWALRKLERWHLHIFIGSFALEVWFMYLTKFVLPHVDATALPGFLSTLDIFRESFLLTYQFWFVAGGIIACHYQKILAFADKHVRWVWLLLVAAVAADWGHFLIVRFLLGQSQGMAETVLQPIMVPYSLIVTAAIWYAGVLWSRRRERPEWRKFTNYVQVASNASFGMYLVQPIPLYFMELAIKHWNVPAWVHYSSLPFSIAFVYGSSMFISHYIGKVPWVAYSVGRKVKTIRRKNSVPVRAELTR